MSSATSPHQIRNVCILAHVDHGKSSYADSLLAANNIITPKMAGKLRYLDSRPDEQERGITMKSSAVSLAYATLRPDPNGIEQLQQFRINLIDTPGHVDFTTEVSTASRLCDGALVLVDVVEGVCTQTISVLRQVWNEQLKPILVINKVDRLIVELRLSPTEAYYHLVRLVEQVNAIMGSFFFTDRIEQDLRWREAAEQSQLESKPTPEKPFTETDDQDIYFDPTKGDVIFSSAIDNWSFNIASFAHIWSKKLGIEKAKLESCLWGDFFFDPKSKKVLSKKQASLKGSSLKPMFVQFVLDNLWAVYDSVVLNPDTTKTEKIIQSLGLKIRLQDLKSKDSKNLLLAICSQWLPISNTTFRTIVAKVPDPITSQSRRLPKMLYPDLPDTTQATPHNNIERDLYAGRSDDSSHVVIYVSKMFAVPISELPQFQRKQLTAEEMRERGRAVRVPTQAASATNGAIPIHQAPASAEIGAIVNPASSELPSTTPAPIPQAESTLPEDPTKNGTEQSSPDEGEALIGFARIYSGTVRVNQKLICVLPKYNSNNPDQLNSTHLKTVTIENLYIIMGRSLVETTEVRAGHVFGIGGLAGKVLRNATLCAPPISKANNCERDENFDELINLAGVQLASAPIVRVSLEPKQPSDMPKLVEGLKLLNQSDPCVETLIQDTGEHVILTAGELHLERCLRDLRERFAKIQIQASKPIVPFRETAVRAAEMTPPKTQDQPRGTICGSVLGGLVSFTVRAIPMPGPITNYLSMNSELMRRISLREARKLNPTNSDLDTTATAEPSSTNKEDPAAASLTEEAQYKQKQQQRSDISQASPNDSDSFFWAGLVTACKACADISTPEIDWLESVDSIWAFGPKRSGANLLLDKLPGSVRSLRSPNRKNSRSVVVEEQAQEKEGGSKLDSTQENQSSSPLMSMREFDDSIETAFQLATFKGPLCAEPMSGLCFSIERLEIHGDDLAASVKTIRSKWSQLTGELISALQDAFKSAFLDWSPRLMLAMYTCEIQATTEVLGKVYGVIARRKGTIKSEEIKEGTTFYTIVAQMPMIESFGFNDELMKKTSGVALPQFVFDGFQVAFDLDPFWLPTTEAELEDFGSLADKENLPRKYIDQVRKRKGMFVEKKIVQHAEKQRTMKR